MFCGNLALPGEEMLRPGSDHNLINPHAKMNGSTYAGLPPPHHSTTTSCRELVYQLLESMPG
jgi:hypothetical protein